MVGKKAKLSCYIENLLRDKNSSIALLLSNFVFTSNAEES